MNLQHTSISAVEPRQQEQLIANLDIRQGVLDRLIENKHGRRRTFFSLLWRFFATVQGGFYMSDHSEGNFHVRRKIQFLRQSCRIQNK